MISLDVTRAMRQEIGVLSERVVREGPGVGSERTAMIAATTPARPTLPSRRRIMKRSSVYLPIEKNVDLDELRPPPAKKVNSSVIPTNMWWE